LEVSKWNTLTPISIETVASSLGSVGALNPYHYDPNNQSNVAISEVLKIGLTAKLATILNFFPFR